MDVRTALSEISAGVAVGGYDIGPAIVDSVASLVLDATISAMWMPATGNSTSLQEVLQVQASTAEAPGLECNVDRT